MTWHFTWNGEDRLTHVTTPAGDRWDYHYDALGRRIGKQHTTVEDHATGYVAYTWDGGQIAEQYDGVTTLSWDYLGLQPLAQREVRGESQEETDRRFFAVVADLTSSPSDLVTPDGDIAWSARTTAWGATQSARDHPLDQHHRLHAIHDPRSAPSSSTAVTAARTPSRMTRGIYS
ncbi:RHS repeat domain-containing protein [Streptomyces sp. NPDC059593]|uniref:RHS repeat domain-containing protein n=1 Tax=Streptomyces sp. NPDC059593 TaxID=3346878 RepID=UPI0036746F7F